MVVEENFPRGKVVFDKDSTKPPVNASLDDEPLFQTGKKVKICIFCFKIIIFFLEKSL